MDLINKHICNKTYTVAMSIEDKIIKWGTEYVKTYVIIKRIDESEVVSYLQSKGWEYCQSYAGEKEDEMELGFSKPRYD